MSTSDQHFDTTILPGGPRKRSERHPVPTLTIIAHPNPDRIGDRSMLTEVSRDGVELSRVGPIFKAPGKTFGGPLDDPFISREPLLLKPDGEGGFFLIKGESRTEVTAWGEARDQGPYFSQQAIETGAVIVLAGRVVLLLHWTRPEPGKIRSDHGLIGHSDAVEFLRREIDRVGDLQTPVLLRGGSGTGKELVARAIHQAGGGVRPFVSVNLGAIPPTLAASELFGAVKGSFTGAERHQEGYFRAARGGTLFLDEAGEAPVEVQVMLLRALESGEISPVGAQTTIKISTRLLAATDADLESKIAKDSFKSPLFHRLAGYEIHLAPLNKRLDDFGRLFVHFAREELKQVGELHLLNPRAPQDPPWLPADLAVRLLAFSWPGNIRQLRNAVRQLVIGCRGESCLQMVPKLAEMLAAGPKTPASTTSAQEITLAGSPKPRRRKPRNVSDEEVEIALKANQWDIKAAASQLGISRGALYLLIDKIPGLQKAADLTPEQIQTSLDRHGGDIKSASKDLGVSPPALRRRITTLGL